MNAQWVRSFGKLVTFGSMVGCTPPGPNLKTPVPEQYAVPPASDPRFSSPPAYPKETLNQDGPKSPGNLPKLPSQMPSIAPNGLGRGPGAGGF